MAKRKLYRLKREYEAGGVERKTTRHWVIDGNGEPVPLDPGGVTSLRDDYVTSLGPQIEEAGEEVVPEPVAAPALDLNDDEEDL